MEAFDIKITNSSPSFPQKINFSLTTVNTLPPPLLHYRSPALQQDFVPIGH